MLSRSIKSNFELCIDFLFFSLVRFTKSSNSPYPNCPASLFFLPFFSFLPSTPSELALVPCVLLVIIEAFPAVNSSRMDTTTERRTSKRSSSDVDKMTSRTSKKTSSNNRTSSTSNKAAPKSTKFEPSDRLKADQKLQSKLYKASCLLVARFKKGLYFEPLACNGAEYFLSDREPFRNNSVPFQSLVKKDPPPRFVTNTGISQALDKNAPPEHRRRSESKASGVARDLLAEARTEAVELARRFQGDLGSYYRPDVDDTVPRLINSTQTVTIYRMEDVPAALQTDPKIGWISKHPVDDRDDGRTKAYDSAKNTSRKFEEDIPALLEHESHWLINRQTTRPAS